MKIHQVCHKWQGKSTWLLKLDEPQNLLTITYINHRNISIIWHRRCFQRVIFSCQEQESLYTSFGIIPYFDHYHIKAFQGKKNGLCFCGLRLKYLQLEQRTFLSTPRQHEQGRASCQHLKTAICMEVMRNDSKHTCTLCAVTLWPRNLHQIRTLLEQK